MTAKGVKKSYIKKHVTHQMFLHTLLNKTCTVARFLNFRSRNHTPKTPQIDKIYLSAYDDKRFLLWDGKNSLIYVIKTFRRLLILCCVIETFSSAVYKLKFCFIPSQS